ncbi:MAG: hypothetical protein ABI861_11795 [Panacibacter sp.]
MEQLDVQINNLHTKLQQLLKQNQLLQKQNAVLQKENISIRETLETKKETIAKLQQQMDAIKLSANSLDENEKLALRKRIDMYLAEIEKCLTLINE